MMSLAGLLKNMRRSCEAVAISALLAAPVGAGVALAGAYAPHKPGEATSLRLVADAPSSAASKRAFRSDVFEISLRSPDAGPHGYETEFKLRMNAGDAFVYTWTVEGLTDPEEFFFDFHGETVPEKGQPESTPTSYQRESGGQGAGYLVAPFAGVHGWYFQNQSGLPVVVRLRVSGFYELIYPGEFGNEGGIVPVAPAVK